MKISKLLTLLAVTCTTMVATAETCMAEDMCPVTVCRGSVCKKEWVPCAGSGSGSESGSESDEDEMPRPNEHEPGYVDPNDYPSENEQYSSV